jgi:NAD(P)H dehydrogenase (quinone)
MTSPTNLVTGATGKTGAATVMNLRAHGRTVRALVHRRDARSERLRDAGAEIVVGSLERFDELLVAMRGVHRAYFCPPLASGALRKATLFAEAAREAKLEVVVALSQWLVDPMHRSVHATEKWLAGRVFARLGGPEVVTIDPGFFADNYMAALEPIAQLGVFGMPLGDGRNAPPSNEDLGRVISAILIDPARHIGNTYRPTGPALLTPGEIAATFAKVLGRRVTYRPASLPLFMKVARSLGVPDYVILQLHAFLEDYQRDSFAVGAPTDVVRAIGGAPPEPFDAIVARYVSRSPVARTSFGRKLRAIANVLRALATPGPNLDAIGRRLELPIAARATLAADSPRWRTSHAAR